MTDNELSAYQAAMPLYFPRSPEEEEWAASRLPSDVGGEFGQPLRPGRGVTVAGRLAPEGASGDNNDNDLLDEIAAAEQTAVGFSPFAKMEEDHDKKVMSRRRTSNSVETENEEMLRSLHYTKLLKIAKTEDFSNFSALRCLYRSGVDWQGRAVIVFVARQISFNGIDLDKALLYLINVLEPLAAKAYSIVYLHSMCSVDNTPDMSFLRRVYNSLPSKFGRNLNAFYVVHPTVFSRVFMWFFTQFTASQMKDRYHSFNSLHQLYSFIPSDQLDIPPFVLHHDMRVNPDNYKGDSEQQLPRLTESVATGWTVDEL